MLAFGHRDNAASTRKMRSDAPSPPRIRYMGNKTALATHVAQIVHELDPGGGRPLVDLFSGMCSIAGAISVSRRPVWSNDVQCYARLAAYCLTASRDLPPDRQRAVEVLAPRYRTNLRKLRQRFGPELAVERRILASDSRVRYLRAYADWAHAGNDDRVRSEVARLRRKPTGPHRLATLMFAWGYFGLQQSIEIDSVRAAIDGAVAQDDLTTDEAAWCRLALLQTCSRVASSPGHFAQYLKADSDAGYQRIQTARRASVWDGVLSDLGELRPYGTRRWRSRNQVFSADALEIWPSLDEAGLRRGIFYADPPYSKEHYSRFHHVLETLELYDYPESYGVGRYRPDRFTTPLATKRGALAAARTIFASVADRKGVLVLSYPSSGVLTAGLAVDVECLLREYFDAVTVAIRQPMKHSTMGGRHGRASHDVVEYVWTGV